MGQDNKCLPTIYWLPKPLKTTANARYIIAAPKCSLKPSFKAITSTLKLFYNQIESYNNKNHLSEGKYW